MQDIPSTVPQRINGGLSHIRVVLADKRVDSAHG
jgi:hypothetical protein